MAASLVRRAWRLPLYVSGRLARRDPQTWLFGNEKGFRDSPRYLAEHITAERAPLRAWWVARTERELKQAAAAGLDAVLRGTSESARLHRRAGAAFLTHGFQDVEAVWLGGAFLVHLFHGTALKRTGLDVDFNRFTDASLGSRFVTGLHRWSLARGWSQVKMFVAPSQLAMPRYVSAFECDPATVHVLGSPRFDVIRGGPAYERAAAGDVRGQLGVRADEHLVAWLPTWRERGDAAWLPELDGRLLQELLAGTSVVVVAKPHPYSQLDIYRERLPEHQRFRLLPEAKVDVNCLMHVADQLITDYSSVSFDYSILHRPIHFLAPDIAEYGRGRDFYEPFDTITQGRQHDAWEPLLRSIAQSAAGARSDALENTEWIAEHTGNRDEPGTIDRIVDAVSGAMLAG